MEYELRRALIGILAFLIIAGLSAVIVYQFPLNPARENAIDNTPGTSNLSGYFTTTNNSDNRFISGDSTSHFELLSEIPTEELRSRIDAIYMGYWYETSDQRTERYLQVLIYQMELILRHGEAK